MEDVHFFKVSLLSVGHYRSNFFCSEIFQSRLIQPSFIGIDIGAPLSQAKRDKGRELMLKLNCEKLLLWFNTEKIDYPWSWNKSPYFVWISEIMLQQTVATSVIPYFKQWCCDYPHIRGLAEAELAEVLSHWEGLGYYSRCRNIHKAAKIIINAHWGKLPRTYRELNALPGIGDYTSRAILSIAYRQPYAVLDANVRRIFQRLTGTIEWEKRFDKEALRELEKKIPSNRPGDFNEAMMQLGQQLCTSSSPKCHLCPLSEDCLAFKHSLAEKIPLKIKKRIKIVERFVLLFTIKGKILLCKKKRGLFHDLWLLPQIQWENGENIVWMEYSSPVIEWVKLKKRNHFYTDNKAILTPYLCKNPGLEPSFFTPKDNEDYAYKWVELKELQAYPTPSVYRKILNEALAFIF